MLIYDFVVFKCKAVFCDVAGRYMYAEDKGFKMYCGRGFGQNAIVTADRLLNYSHGLHHSL